MRKARNVFMFNFKLRKALILLMPSVMFVFIIRILIINVSFESSKFEAILRILNFKKILVYIQTIDEY